MNNVTVKDLSWLGKAIIMNCPRGQMWRKFSGIANCLKKGKTLLKHANKKLGNSFPALYVVVISGWNTKLQVGMWNVFLAVIKPGLFHQSFSHGGKGSVATENEISVTFYFFVVAKKRSKDGKLILKNAQNWKYVVIKKKMFSHWVKTILADSTSIFVNLCWKCMRKLGNFSPAKKKCRNTEVPYLAEIFPFPRI